MHEVQCENKLNLKPQTGQVSKRVSKYPFMGTEQSPAALLQLHTSQHKTKQRITFG